LLVGVALREDPVVTRVFSGENAGKTLTDRYAVRKFAFERVTLNGDRPASLTFPLALAQGWDAAHCGVAIFVQNWDDGRVHQAEALAWPAAGKLVKGPRPAAR
jgi:hypothetical protein